MKIKDIKTFAELQTALKGKEVSGYIWMVSHKKPYIYQNKEIDFTKLEYSTPVYNKIQEAYLFDGINSIHIKNIDGKECFFVFPDDHFNDEKNKDKYTFKDIKFPSHKINDKNLKFKQIYKLEASISGDDFKTYQPIARLFKGFSNTKKD